ncbi:heterokaryon incompatibility protein-domain-containing protein [Nemania sp. FL0031]|nr:heterokaryon incompatibility protein-domain-containing protein [Nemania sp. FL0031]
MQVAAAIKRQAGIDPAEQMISVSSGDHFRPGCACAKLHIRCGDSAVMASSQAPRMHAWRQEITVNYSLEELRNSAETGCWFCSIIYGGIKACPQWDGNRMEMTSLRKSWRIEAGSLQNPGCQIELFGQKDPALEFYTQTGGAPSRCELLQVQQEFPVPNVISILQDYVLKNRRDCDRLHTCEASKGSEMPTRLLDIKVSLGKYAIQLLETKDLVEKEPYVTLSHCWGKSPTAKTTDSTLDKMRHGVDWSVLPQTFKDAIAVTHLLGYRYLWIDALCIIQGNKIDWEYESARMNQVYANCDLMLSADRAIDTYVESWEPLVSKDTQQGTRVRFQKRHRVAGSMFANEAEGLHIAPLHTRAWSFQEFHMAPRILHFCIDELQWDCNGGQDCQCGLLNESGGGLGGLGTNDKSFLEKHRSKANSIVREKASIWRIIVYRYSSRMLTNWTDRLPAISGLVKQFIAEKAGESGGIIPVSQEPEFSIQPSDACLPFNKVDLGTYLAGLWSNDIKTGLCWRVEDDHRPRNSFYVAPSWSWASVHGRVNWSEPAEGAFEIEDPICIPDGIDITGAVSRGQLTLFGSVIPLQLVLCNQQPRSWTWYSCMLVRGYNPDTGVDEDLETFHPDVVPEFPLNHRFGHYYLSDIPSEGHVVIDSDIQGVMMSKTVVLVPRPSAGEGTFERIGIIDYNITSGETLDKSKFFRYSQRKKLVIV